MFSFLHAADLHLDSPLRNLDQYEGAPVDDLRSATRRALENLVELALREPVRFVVLAGDVYDGNWQDARTGLFFVRQMARLKSRNIRVFLISGNHDAANRMSRLLTYPDNVRTLDTAGPETVLLDDLRVAIHGQGYATQAETRNLAAGYPASLPGWFNIGLLHTALDGRENHDAYAPCTKEELIGRNYDYWALGHVHAREPVNGEAWPRIEFPGNIQGRHIKETGAKGCLLVRVQADWSVHVAFHPLDVLRWQLCLVDCTGVNDRAALLARVAETLTDAMQKAGGRILAARVQLIGRTSLHHSMLADLAALRDDIRSLGQEHAPRLWIEAVKLQTSAPDETEEAPLSEDALSELAAVFRELAQEPSRLAEILSKEDLPSLARSLPAELRDGADALPLTNGDPEWLARARATLFAAAAAAEDAP